MARFLAGGAFSVLVALVGLATPAHGAVVLQMSNEDLVLGADQVVRGRVIAARSRRDDTWRGIVTDFTIEVRDRMKGRGTSRVVVTELGGRIGDDHQWVPGAPRYRVGSEVVAFLYADRERNSALRTLGMSQGVFFVEVLPETGEEIVVRNLEDTTLAVTDPDGVIRPHPELVVANEPPRPLAALRFEIDRFLSVVPTDLGGPGPRR